VKRGLIRARADVVLKTTATPSRSGIARRVRMERSFKFSGFPSPA
jgi:hypothetical protein